MELGQSCINQPSDPTGFNSIGRPKKVIFGNRGCTMHGFFSRETRSNNGIQAFRGGIMTIPNWRFLLGHYGIYCLLGIQLVGL